MKIHLHVGNSNILMFHQVLKYIRIKFNEFEISDETIFISKVYDELSQYLVLNFNIKKMKLVLTIEKYDTRRIKHNSKTWYLFCREFNIDRIGKVIALKVLKEKLSRITVNEII